MTDLSTADVKAPAEPSSSESQSPPKRKDTDPFADWDSYRTSKIEIKVDKPILREELFAKYYVYKIQGTDLKGYFEVSRRYSDFEKVRQLLVSRWPGCFVPSLPSKKINNMGKTVVEDRTKNLDAFCRRVADIPHLHYSDVYQVFLRTKMVDLDPILATYQKVRYDDIIDRYSKVFRHLAEKEVESDAIFKITAFAAFLKKSEAQFEKFKKVGKTFIEARKTFTQELANMHNMMSEDYEKNVFSEYHGRKNEKNVFFDALNPKPNEHIETIRDLQKQESVEKLYEWIKSEGRDILAFSEAFAQRDKYESLKGKAETRQRTDTKDLQNMSMGKTTLKTLFTKNDKKEETMAKMENKITSTAKDIENLGVVQELITAVMAYEEIDKFKANKVETYYEVVGQTAKHELKTFAAVQEYWAGMLENRNIKQLDV